MNSNGRTATRGGKGAKGDKTHKAEKIDTGKLVEKQQSGGGDSVRAKNDDPSIKDKVKLIMDMTQRSEAEVCSALHDCDNDVEQAANMLFENNTSVVSLLFNFSKHSFLLFSYTLVVIRVTFNSFFVNTVTCFLM